MRAETASDPKLIASYEGMIRKTASLTADNCEEDFEDICQVFRITAWKALLSFDPTAVTSGSKYTPEEQRDRYVFSCIKNRGKDFLKRPKRNPVYIEEITSDADSVAESHCVTPDNFMSKYLRVAEEEVFGSDAFTLPLSLTARERRIVTFLYLGFDNGEIGEQLGIKRKQVATLVRGIRVKMADWAPPGWQSKQEEPAAAQPLPLPVAQPAAAGPVPIAA
jgi:RNA polymerase sigma factor (sigma-70 family)